jgi:hypothetical protein
LDSCSTHAGLAVADVRADGDTLHKDIVVQAEPPNQGTDILDATRTYIPSGGSIVRDLSEVKRQCAIFIATMADNRPNCDDAGVARRILEDAGSVRQH